MAARHARAGSSAPAGSRPASPHQWPVEPQRRAATRRDIRAQVMADAERRVREVGRTLKCYGWGGMAPPQHAGEPGGCANDGTGCICECHDPTPEEVGNR